MAFTKTGVTACAAFAVAAPLALAIVTPSNADTTADGSQPPVRNIDLDTLASGEKPQTPYLADGKIRTPDAQIAVPSGLDITTFAAVGPASFVAIDDTTGDGMHNRLVRIDQDGVTELAEGPITRPFVVSDGGDQIAWAEWTGERGRLVLANPDNGNVLEQTEIDSETYTVGFIHNSVVLEPASSGPASVWRPGEEMFDIDQTEGATATDPANGILSVIRGQEEDPETGETLTCSAMLDPGVGYDEVWRTCDSTPISYSPDGDHIWAKDTRTDPALPSSMYLLDVSTGERLQQVKTDGTMRRVSWEPDGSVLLDVYNDGKMALVRCGIEAGDDCELATEPAEHQDHSLEAPLPYLLAGDS